MEELVYIAEVLRSTSNNDNGTGRRGGGLRPGGAAGGYRPRSLQNEKNKEIGKKSFKTLQQEYLANSNKETAKNLVMLGKWRPGTLRGKKQWTNYAANLQYSQRRHTQLTIKSYKVELTKNRTHTPNFL